MVLAAVIGKAALGDLYRIGNETPNIVYELLLGGVLSATLVPIFVTHVETDDDEGTSAVISVSAVLLLAITVFGWLAAPLIVDILTLGVPGAVLADQQEVATSLLRLFMPQMLFYGLFAMGAALLNARRRFAAPAFAPVLNNLLVAGVLLLLPALAGGTPTLGQVRDDPVLLLTLGLGTTAGIAAMTAALWPSVRRTGARLRFNLDWRNRSVRQVGRLSGWTFGYVLANQVALLVVLVLASSEDGGVSAYTGAFIFFLLPHALFAVSIMTTLVPELSACAGRGDMAGYRSRFSMGLRLMTLVVAPAAIGYVVLAAPIVTALLEHGALSEEAGTLTGDVLASFGLGLFGFSVYLYTLRGFYALKDTRTPFFLNLGQNAAQIALCFTLRPFFGVRGLALAYGAAYTIFAVVALVVLRNRVGRLEGRRVARTVAKVGGACAVLAVAVLLVAYRVGDGEGLGALVRTAVGVVVGTITYGIAVVALRVEEVTDLGRRLLRGRSRAPSA